MALPHKSVSTGRDGSAEGGKLICSFSWKVLSTACVLCPSPLILVLRPVEKYVFSPQEMHGVPPAVVLSWSDNNSTTLSFKVTNDSDRWAVCFSSAGASIACRSIRKSDPYSCFHNYPVILNSPRSHRWEWGKDGKAVEASTTLSLSHRLSAVDWMCSGLDLHMLLQFYSMILLFMSNANFCGSNPTSDIVGSSDCIVISLSMVKYLASGSKPGAAFQMENSCH